MTSPAPLVTIGVPVFNEERYLPGAIDTLLAQTLGDFELLVADNGSTDATETVCRRYLRLDDRVSYLRSDVNRGAAWNYNRLVLAARGRYFKWAAADDLHAPEFLERCVAVLEADPSAVACHTESVDIDGDGCEIGPLDYPWQGGAHDVVARFAGVLMDPHPCVDIFGVIRTDALRRTKLQGAFYSADRVFLAELALHGRFATVPGRLFLHREHEGRSIRKFPHRYAAAGWWDPARGNAVTFPTWRYGVDALHAIARAPLPVTTRVRCAAQVLKWSTANVAPLARDVAIAGRTIVRGRADRRAAATAG